MGFVLDASIAAAWVLPDEEPVDTDELLARLAIDGAAAPSLFWYEMRNILIVATRKGRLPEGEAGQALARLRRLPIETVDMTLSGDATAIDLAERRGLTAYDAAYLLLALERELPLATADKALARAARSEGVAVLTAGRSA